jgi:hypothetical protein
MLFLHNGACILTATVCNKTAWLDLHTQQQEARDWDAACKPKKSRSGAAAGDLQAVSRNNLPANCKDAGLKVSLPTYAPLPVLIAVFYQGQKVVGAPPTPNPTLAPAPAHKPEPVFYHLLPGPCLALPRCTTKQPTATKPSTATKKAPATKLLCLAPIKTIRAVSPVDAEMVSNIDGPANVQGGPVAKLVCHPHPLPPLLTRSSPMTKPMCVCCSNAGLANVTASWPLTTTLRECW